MIDFVLPSCLYPFIYYKVRFKQIAEFKTELVLFSELPSRRRTNFFFRTDPKGPELYLFRISEGIGQCQYSPPLPHDTIGT